MLSGIIESALDARWVIRSGKHPSNLGDVFVDRLAGVALWYAYEIARNPDASDIRVDDDGYLVIHLNDDANPPGWYHYKRRAASDEEARAVVRAKFGDVVAVPLRAVLSDKVVGP